MDADKEPRREEEKQAGQNGTTAHISSRSGRRNLVHRSSADSQDPPADTDTDADLLSSDMDRAGDGYRRRRAQVMRASENGSTRRKRSDKKHVHRPGNGSSTFDEENSQLVYSSDEDRGLDFSSRTTSEDFELDRLTAEDPFSDDAEAGMTKQDRKNRKRRRRKAARMDERFAGDAKASKTSNHFSYSAIYTAWLVNALLVASWYAFSLSISIVSEGNRSPNPASC